jgi:RNA polymerase sigma factor (sigma-70 family)
VPDAPPKEDGISRPDVRLVRECLRGSEEAWAALLDKYKNLIFSIPMRQGIPRDDAGDIFQRVCILLLAELPHLRHAEALPMWLIRVTSRECGQWRRQQQPYAGRESAEAALAVLADASPAPEEMLAQVKDEQMLREAVRALPPRCRQLVQMLFFETPARPYQQVASALGLAAGSIGFIRGRCLTRLRRQLERAGYR